jgi:hypothetical protein
MTRIQQFSRSAVTHVLGLIAVMFAAVGRWISTRIDRTFDRWYDRSNRILALLDADGPAVARRLRLGMIRIDTSALTQDQLQAASTPASALEGETIAYSFWDTQTYPSGGQQLLTFFQTVQSDPSLSNMPAAGLFPNPIWFCPQFITLDALGVPSNLASTASPSAFPGLAADLYTLSNAGRLWFQFTLAQKIYAQFPASGIHPSGGPVVFTTGTFVSPTQQQWALWGVPDGDLYVGPPGTLVIPPMQNFTVQLFTSSTAPTITTSLPIRMTMWGSIIRRVL